MTEQRNDDKCMNVKASKLKFKSHSKSSSDSETIPKVKKKKKKSKEKRKDEKRHNIQPNTDFERYNDESEWTQHLFDTMAEDEYQDNIYVPNRWMTTTDVHAKEETYDDWAESIRIGMERKRRENDERYKQQEKWKAEQEMRRKQESQRARDRERIEAEYLKERRKRLEKNRKKYQEKFREFKNMISGSLSWRDIPWPISSSVSELADLESALTVKNIKEFLQIDQVDVEVRKSILKDHLLVWHPDKFHKYKKLISNDEWGLIEPLANIVSKILIEINEN